MRARNVSHGKIVKVNAHETLARNICSGTLHINASNECFKHKCVKANRVEVIWPKHLQDKIKGMYTIRLEQRGRKMTVRALQYALQ